MGDGTRWGCLEGRAFQSGTGIFWPTCCFIGTTHLGSRKEMIEILQLEADKGIQYGVEEIPISIKSLAEGMNKLETS